MKWLYADSQSFPSLLLHSSQITLINPLNLCTCHSWGKSLLIESPPLRCTHHHRPWNLLLKVIGETLVCVSSILLKRYLLFYLGMFVFVCWYVYMFVLGLWDFSFLGRFLLLQGWIYPILGKCRRYIFRFLFCFIFE